MGLPGGSRACERGRRQWACLGGSRACERGRRQWACLGAAGRARGAESNAPAWGAAGGTSEGKEQCAGVGEAAGESGAGATAPAWGMQEVQTTQGMLPPPGARQQAPAVGALPLPPLLGRNSQAVVRVMPLPRLLRGELTGSGWGGREVATPLPGPGTGGEAGSGMEGGSGGREALVRGWGLVGIVRPFGARKGEDPCPGGGLCRGPGRGGPAQRLHSPPRASPHFPLVRGRGFWRRACGCTRSVPRRSGVGRVGSGAADPHLPSVVVVSCVPTSPRWVRAPLGCQRLLMCGISVVWVDEFELFVVVWVL